MAIIASEGKRQTVNVGTRSGMSPRTQLALWSFWDYAAFVINSLLFLLIGMQVRIGDLARGWHAALLAIGAVLVGRMLSVYILTPLSNLLSERIPLRWQHVLVWGGLRGALALALALSLDPDLPYRADLLAWTFGVVAFSLIVQGLTIKPLLRTLGMAASTETEYDRTKVRQVALSSARTELDELLRSHVISAPVHARLRREFDSSLAQAETQIAQMYKEDAERASNETRTARARLLAAERGAILRAFHDGLISHPTAAKMMDDADRQMDELEQKLTERREQGETSSDQGAPA